MLMRLRIAEIGKNAVSHIFGDIAAKPGNDLSHGGAIGAKHLPQILWIEARGQRGRADQIAEHDSELPALGRTSSKASIFALSRRLGRWNGRTGSWQAVLAMWRSRPAAFVDGQST